MTGISVTRGRKHERLLSAELGEEAATPIGVEAEDVEAPVGLELL